MEEQGRLNPGEERKKKGKEEVHRGDRTHEKKGKKKKRKKKEKVRLSYD